MKNRQFIYSQKYTVDSWQIIEESFDPQDQMLGETVFTLANGYLGIRGSFEEGLSTKNKRSIEGIYLNGFYELVPIPHPEKAYGYAENTETMLNVTDSKIIEIYLEEERVTLDQGTLLSFKRTLDMARGCLTREVSWRSPLGREIMFSFRRIVPLSRQHLVSFELKLTPINFSDPIMIISALDGSVDNHTHEEEDPRFTANLGGLGLNIAAIQMTESGAVILQETKRSGLSLACAIDNCFRSDTAHTVEDRLVGSRAALEYKFFAEQGNTYLFEKHASYFTSRDFPASELINLATDMARKAKVEGFAALADEQSESCQSFWSGIDLELNGDPLAEQGMRFSVFHLLQSAGSKGFTGIPAKGLSSEGYDGHYFWDTEIYMLPFYIMIMPEQARELLKFRYSIIERARERARVLSHEKGALYPWRTIAGEEGSSYYPAGTAQYHINAAVAYAIYKYLELTADHSFIIEYGAEMLFETARLWEDLGAYIPAKGDLFCYNEVTGPDEYTALVNNNCYTNLMARWHLKYAYDTAKCMELEHNREYQRICSKIKLESAEVEAWLQAAENMYIPYDQDKQIHPQDDGFFDKEIWNFAATPPEKYPLLLHYHPLVIYRYQVCKQPDVILAQLLLDGEFDLNQKRRNYDYYEAITTHDSSLSPSIFSMAAAELGYKDDAYSYFFHAARLDLDNIFSDSHYGLHLANMAGTWQALVHGFAGMRSREGELRFNPYIPGGWVSYQFCLNYRNFLLKIRVTDQVAEYQLLKGAKISLFHHQHKINIKLGEKVTVPVSVNITHDVR